MRRQFKYSSCAALLAGLGLLVASQRSGQAAGIYSTATLGPGTFAAMNDQGQVLLTPKYGNPNNSTYLYTAYGPNAGTEVNAGGGGSTATFLTGQGPVVVLDSSFSKNLGGNSTPFPIVSTGNLTGINMLGTPLGVNDVGQVVGQSATPGDPNAKPGDPVAPGHSQWYLNGDHFTDIGPTHAYLSTNGIAKDLGTLGGYYSTAKYVNDAGQVAGNADLANGGTHGFLYSNGKMVDLGTLPGYTGGSSANGMNASGQVVGFSFQLYNYQAMHAFLFSGGLMKDLGTLPGDTTSVASAIDDAGDVVGQSGNRAFLYSHGVMTDLNSLLPVGSGVHLDDALGINNLGQIVAMGEDRAGDSLLYLLTPPGLPTPASFETPEPTTLALAAMLAGLAGVRRWVGRRKAVTQA